jgi:hypothetical protein
LNAAAPSGDDAMEIFLDEQKAAEDNQRERQRGSRE